MDLMTLVRQLMADGTVARIARNPLAQFGTPEAPLLGATLLPEQTTLVNEYRETAIRYRTVIANAGSRYSPVQIKDGSVLSGEMLVTLADEDIGAQFTGRDYDALITLLGQRPAMDAAVRLINWLDVAVNRALVHLTEKQRWDAIVDAQVVRKGDNGYTETITYSNPSGHRVNAGGTWSDNNYDPYPDIIAGAQKLADKGYMVSRMIASRKVAYILARNAKMQGRVGGRIVVTPGGAMQSQPRPLVTLAELNAIFNADGLPTLELFESRYRDYAGTHRFLADTALVMVATTGREQVITETNIENGNLEIIPDTLGYTAIGRPVGQTDAGRVIMMEPKADKPPRVEAQGWQTSLPVITEPEALYVVKAIA